MKAAGLYHGPAPAFLSCWRAGHGLHAPAALRLQANPLLHQVFHFQPSASPSGAEEGLSRGELRRLLHSPNSASSKVRARGPISAFSVHSCCRGSFIPSMSNVVRRNFAVRFCVIPLSCLRNCD